MLLSKLDRSGARRYLDDRRDTHFNVIQVMVLHTADAARRGAEPPVAGRPRRSRESHAETGARRGPAADLFASRFR
jgi:hypothetical protein